jgi:hypothetical protein
MKMDMNAMMSGTNPSSNSCFPNNKNTNISAMPTSKLGSISEETSQRF